jgi:hypothetical protein
VFLTEHEEGHGQGSTDRTAERYVALGLTVFIVLFCAYIIIRNDPDPEPNTVVYMRTLLAVACGVLGGTIPGFLNVKYDIGGLAIRAAGGIAFAVLVYVYTPTVLPSLRTQTEKALDRSRSGDIGQLFKLVDSYWDLPKHLQEYQNTDIADRKKLITGWIGDDTSKNNAVIEVPKFLADLHACIQRGRCDDTERLCQSSLFDDANNFLTFFAPLLDDWANSGYSQTLTSAKAFINCDCFKTLAAKLCPNHPTMCSAPRPASCEESRT